LDNSSRFVVVADLRDDKETSFNRVITYEEANQFVNEKRFTYLEVNSKTGFNMDMLTQIIIDNLAEIALRKHILARKFKFPRYRCIILFLCFLCCLLGANVAL
jgi:hypothetical protein